MRVMTAEPGARSSPSRLRGWLPTPEVILLGLAFWVGIGMIRDFDIWWHLAAGREIVQTGIIPTVDSWSHTVAGKDWFAHEWLTEILFYGLYVWGGVNALLLWKALTGLATLILLSRVYQRADPAKGPAYVLGLLAGIICIYYHWLERPHLITNLFLAVQVWCLERWLRGGPDRLKWLVPLYLLWANLHGGVIVGLATFGLYGAGQFISFLADESGAEARLRHIALVALLCLGASLVNPRGVDLVTYPLKYTGAGTLAADITEWTSPDFKEYRPMEVLLLSLLLGLLLVRTGALPTEVILVLAGLHLFLQSKRNIVFLALFVLPVAVDRLRLLFKGGRLEGAFSRADRPGAGRALLVAFVLLVSVHLVWIQPPRISSNYYPQGAVDYLKEAGLGDRPMLNEFVFGGYFVWHLYPEYRVFIDSRTDLFFDQFIFAEYLAVFKLAMGWQEVLDKWDISLMVFEVGHPLSTVLEATGHWKEVYQDRVATIWIRQEADER